MYENFFLGVGTGDCGDPGELANGMVIFSNGTRNGSVVTFQCDPGLSLVGDRVSQCRSGQWTVLPQDVRCTIQEKSDNATLCDCRNMAGQC